MQAVEVFIVFFEKQLVFPVNQCFFVGQVAMFQFEYFQIKFVLYFFQNWFWNCSIEVKGDKERCADRHDMR